MTMGFEIGGSGAETGGIVIHLPKSLVARVAQKAADLAGRTIVVDTDLGAVIAKSATAYRAATVLHFPHIFNLFDG